MLQKWNRYLILQQFFDAPRKGFLVRELSRKTKLAQTSVRSHLQALKDDGLLATEETGLYPVFKARADSPIFRILKKQNAILRIHESGLVEALEKKLYPTCIVIFGSASRGEDNEHSDFDIFIQAKRAAIPLKKFETSLKRRISLLFEPDLKKIPAELLSNLANGQVLSGYLEVR